MCTGAEVAVIGGALASAAGTGVSLSAASAARSRMDQTLRNALVQQEGFQRQATPLFEQSLAQSTPLAVQRQLGEGAAGAGELYRNIQNLPLGTSSLPFDAGRTRPVIEQANRAQAAVQGFGNFSLQQWLKDLEARNRLGLVGGLSRGAAGTVPFQIQSAQNSTADMAALGSLLSTAGSLAGVYGATQQPKGGG